MHDAMGVIHQDARRRQLLQRPAMHHGVVEGSRRIGGSAYLRHLLSHTERPEQAWQQPRLVAGVDSRLVDSCVPIDVSEYARRIVSGLGGTKQQKAAGVERIVERADDLLLQLTIEIDQHIPAGDEIDARKWWIFEEIVLRE